jgi:hypothetical protein
MKLKQITTVLLLSLSFSLSISADIIDSWINDKLIFSDSTGIKLEFNYNIISEYSEYQMPGLFILSSNKEKFIYRLGPKTTIDDGSTWYVIDDRTDQIIIQNPEINLLSDLKRWFEPDTLKSSIYNQGNSKFEYIFHVSEFSDNVKILFSEQDTSLQTIKFSYQLSEIIISDIIIQSVETSDSLFRPDTTDMFILDIRE